MVLISYSSGSTTFTKAMWHCETLHPDNVMARICAGDYTHREKVELCNMLKRIGKTNDYNAYNKFYASLK